MGDSHAGGRSEQTMGRLRSGLRAHYRSALFLLSALALTGCAALSPAATTQVQRARSIVAPQVIYRGTTIAHWSSSFTYGARTYKFRMVGTDPADGSATTTIPVTVVPLSLAFPGGILIDGTQGAEMSLSSPLFVPSAFPEGTTQYGDAIMQGEFWKYAQTENFHVLLGAPTLAPTQSFSVPEGDGTVSIVKGKPRGTVAYAWFMDSVEKPLIAQLGLSPTSLTIFITGNVRLLEQYGACCYYGFHSTFTQGTGSATQTFTTAWGPTSAASVETLSHEVAEWMNDPFNDNVVPGWENPATGKCDSARLEVGDPLVNVMFVQNGYQLQDIAFYSWFSRDDPSIGIDGQYDFRGRLTSPAVVCTPR